MTTRVLRSPLLLCALVAACGGAGARSGGIAGRPNGQTRRFGGDLGAAPPSCGMPIVEQRLSRFFAAFDRGGARIGERFFTDGRTIPFHWFSFTDVDAAPRPLFVTHAPDSLDAYFVSRHSAGERWVLRGAEFNAYDPASGMIGFSPVMFEDYVPKPPGDSIRHLFGMGKGGYHCRSGRFELLSLGVTTDSTQWLEEWNLLGARRGR